MTEIIFVTDSDFCRVRIRAESLLKAEFEKLKSSQSRFSFSSNTDFLEIRVDGQSVQFSFIGELGKKLHRDLGAGAVSPLCSTAFLASLVEFASDQSN